MTQRDLLVLAAFGIGALLTVVLRGSFRRYVLRRRFRRGAEAEREALDLAARAGYRVVGSQVSRTFEVRADAERLPVTVRADMILERGGKTYVAEVKSGRQAPDPASTATRRQLLEYSFAFDADGVLLFDMRARRIRRIEFGHQRRSAALAWLLVGGLLGAVVEAETGVVRRALGIVASLY